MLLPRRRSPCYLNLPEPRPEWRSSTASGGRQGSRSRPTGSPWAFGPATAACSSACGRCFPRDGSPPESRRSGDSTPSSSEARRPGRASAASTSSTRMRRVSCGRMIWRRRSASSSSTWSCTSLTGRHGAPSCNANNKEIYCVSILTFSIRTIDKCEFYIRCLQ